MPTLAQRVAGTRLLTLQDLVLADAPVWASDCSGADVILDLTGRGNTGVVTLGTGTRNAPPVVAGGPPTILWPGAAARAAITDTAVIQNIFNAGGTLVMVCQPVNAGESGGGRLVGKDRWMLWNENLVGGLMKLRFQRNFVTTNGIWDTGQIFRTALPSLIAVTYDASSVANDPTIYVCNAWDGVQVATVGSGLTETSTPVGASVSDATFNFFVADRQTDDLTFGGRTGMTTLFTKLLTQQRITAYYQAMLGLAA